MKPPIADAQMKEAFERFNKEKDAFVYEKPVQMNKSHK
jgi:hypothetical protein